MADVTTRTEIADLTAQLVAIDSTNPDLVPGGAGEGAIAAFVAGWLRDREIDVEVRDAPPGRPNVVGIVRGSGGGKTLMLNAHVDTVGAGGMADPFEPRIDGNRLYGRGAYDMKASLAAIMLTAATAKEARLRGDLIVTAVADEEYASVGTQAIVARYRADAAIVTEPTDLAMCLAHKGFVWLEIATHGTAAHGSLPEEGIDAIVKMARVLTGIGELDHRLRAGCPQPLVGTGSVHASLISGGTELSTYPDLCRVHIERRTVPGETPGLVESEFRQIVAAGAAQDSTFRADLTMGISRDPFHVSEAQPIVRLLKEVATGHLGRVPATIGAGGWMDSALLSAAGIPTVIFGPAGEGAHADVEWVDLDSAATCANILSAVAAAFCM
jgi:acetylornithine deacetylase